MTDAAVIRAWLREQGDDIGERGTIPQAARDRYEAAHNATGGNAGAPSTAPRGPDYPPGMTDADFDISEPGAPPESAEVRPRTVAMPTRRERLASWRRKQAPKGKARKPKPRVPVDDLIAGVWRGLAGFTRPLPPTSRLLKIQAPVAGAILEDTVKGTAVDRLLQPIARAGKSGEAVAVLVGPPLLVTAVQLQPESAPFIMPVLRELMLRWCKVAGPKMTEALKREKEFEEEFGQNVDELLAFLFSDLTVHEGESPLQAEEEAVKRAQETLQDVA
jgi:hypothetical protein